MWEVSLALMPSPLPASETKIFRGYLFPGPGDWKRFEGVASKQLLLRQKNSFSERMEMDHMEEKYLALTKRHYF